MSFDEQSQLTLINIYNHNYFYKKIEQDKFVIWKMCCYRNQNKNITNIKTQSATYPLPSFLIHQNNEKIYLFIHKLFI